MNLRTVSRKYLGWCPGFESASNFIPSRETTPSRLILVVSIISITAFAGFYVSQQGLIYLGYPKDNVANTLNSKPKLVHHDDKLYYATVVKTQTRGQSGYPATFGKESVYLAELSLDGTISNEVKVVDGITGIQNIVHDILVTDTGEWVIAFDYEVITSKNGKEFTNPVTVGIERDWDYSGVNLLEYGQDIILLYSDGDDGTYYFYNSDLGWSKQHVGPLEARMQVPIIDHQGRLSIIGVDYDPKSRNAVMVDGLSYSSLESNDNWTQPTYLSNHGVPIRGYYPNIYYSESRDGYFLITKDPDRSSLIQLFVVQFTPDLMNWTTPVPFQLSENSNGREFYCRDLEIVELDNGTLVMAFHGTYYNNTWSLRSSHTRVSDSLYLSTSQDGREWSAPVEIEKIYDGDTLIKADTSFRKIPSVIISVISALISIYVVSKNQLLFV